jgi:N4-gp56 family major capsid protein
LLLAARPALVHGQFCDDKPIAKHTGTTMHMRRFELLTVASTPLVVTEGLTPDSDVPTVTDVPVSIAQYVRWIQYSDMSVWASIDDLVAEFTKLLGFAGAQTLDQVYRNFMVAGTNIIFSGNSGNVRTADSALTAPPGYNSASAGDTFGRFEVKSAVQQLESNYAKPWDGANYFSVIHPKVKFDIQNIPDWIAAAEYSNPDAIYQGEVGVLYGIRFVLSPLAYIATGAGASGANVYYSPVFGDGAFGKSEITGENMELIVKAPGTSGVVDPANQRGSVAFKATAGGTILNQKFVVRVDSTATNG